MNRFHFHFQSKTNIYSFKTMPSAKKHLICFTLILLALLAVNSDALRNPFQQDEPSVPPAPNCGTNFPGSDQWNQCWEAFQTNMNWFQENVQHYAAKFSKTIAKNRANGKSYFPKTSDTGTSNNNIGVNIQGLSVSISYRNEVVQVKLFPIPGMEEIKSKINGNELELRVGTEISARWAKIRFGKPIKISDLKFQRMDDAILISGPTKDTFDPVEQHQSWWSKMSPFSNGGSAMAPVTDDSKGRQPKQKDSQ